MTVVSLEMSDEPEIITYGLNVVLTRYEEQYGKIRVKKHNKGNIEKLLNK